MSGPLLTLSYERPIKMNLNVWETPGWSAPIHIVNGVMRTMLWGLMQPRKIKTVGFPGSAVII